MRFEAFVAARYLRGKRKSRFISLITVISVAGVCVGVMALIVVMGVMTGFDQELEATIIGNRSHLFIRDITGAPIQDYEALIAQLKERYPEIVAAGPVIEVKGLLQKRSPRGGYRYEGAFILGVEPAREAEVTQLAENLTEAKGRRYGRGELPEDKEIVLGYLLANNLRAAIGDDISAFTPRTKMGPGGARFSPVYLTVSGVSQAQMSEFDQFYGWVNLRTAEMLKGQEGVDGIHCKLTNHNLAARLGQQIEDDLGYTTITWYQSQQAFFEALQQEKVVMFIILIFIVLVAAFNITSTLIMVVMEKKRDIGILRTIGVSARSVLLLFMLEGLYIGLSGTFLGVILGYFLAHNLNPLAEVIAWWLEVDLYNSTIYYFDSIPVAVLWSDVITITIASVILTFISTLYPAWSASRLHPVDALRYD